MISLAKCHAVLVALALVAGAAAAQNTPPVDVNKARTIRRLLELTQAAQGALGGLEAALPAQRRASPQIPAVFWDEFLARAKRDVNKLVDMLVPIYAAHFSQADLDALVAFYQTPLGRRLAAAQPVIGQESIAAGQRWGEEIGRQVAQDLQRQGKLQSP